MRALLFLGKPSIVDVFVAPFGGTLPVLAAHWIGERGLGLLGAMLTQSLNFLLKNKKTARLITAQILSTLLQSKTRVLKTTEMNRTMMSKVDLSK
jgi:hypothetical protein